MERVFHACTRLDLSPFHTKRSIQKHLTPSTVSGDHEGGRLVGYRSDIGSENGDPFCRVGSTCSLHNPHLINKLHLNQRPLHLLHIQLCPFIIFIRPHINPPRHRIHSSLNRHLRFPQHCCQSLQHNQNFCPCNNILQLAHMK